MITLRKKRRNSMQAISDESRRKLKKEWHLNMLEEAKNKHIPTFVNGVLASYNKMDSICLLLEDDSYMYDFDQDDGGHVISLCFDKVTQY